jgi:hypothetical protein
MAMQKERRAAPHKPAPASEANPATLSKEDVYRQIQETAYFKAKARGFEPGGEVQDWIEAEAEVRRRVQPSP